MQSLLLAFLSTADAGSFGTEIKRNYDADLSRGNRLIYDNIIYHDLKRGVHSAPVALANKFYQYSAQLLIGSDQQLVAPSIDTGSSDLWVMQAENPYCTQPDFDCAGQIFEPLTSQTFRNLSLPWQISYLDTTGAFGFLSSDNLMFKGSDTTIRGAKFALANTANSSAAVFGIGFVADESSHIYQGNNTWGGYTYQNVPAMIKDQGLISRIAYSLYLNDVNAGEGQLLFGGVDHAKYQGTLTVMPMVNIYRTVKEIIDIRVMFSGISVKTGNSVCDLAEFSIPVLLDSGTSFALLPARIIAPMAAAMGFTLEGDDIFYSGDCVNAFAFDSFELDFSGLKLQVPPGSLLDYKYESDWLTEIYKNGRQQCILAIQPSEERTSFIMGDVFMRNFYLVYDLEGFQVAMAQANFNAGDSDVEDIVDSIPAAVSVPRYFSTAMNSTIVTADPQRCFKPSQSRSASVFTKPPVETPSGYFRSSSSSSRVVSGAQATAISSHGGAFTSKEGPRVPRFSASRPRANAVSVASSVSRFSSTQASSIASNANTDASRADTNASSADTNASRSSSAQASSTASRTNATASNTSRSAQASSIASASTYITSVSGPTTITAGTNTYTATESTVLTITDCGCTNKEAEMSTTAHTTTIAAPSYTTTIVTAFVTTCSAPTTFATNGQTYTVTEPTVITVTNCPCTLSIPLSSSNSLSSSSGAKEITTQSSLVQSSSSSYAPLTASSQLASSTGTVPPMANGASRLAVSFGLMAGMIGLLV